jgi:hypothetical protein
LGADCGDDRVLGELMLGYAVLSNARGSVLFSSIRSENIARNAEVARQPPPMQLERFAALACDALKAAA